MPLFQILDEVEKRRGISPALVQPLMRSVMEAPFPALGRTITVKNFLPGSGTEVKILPRERETGKWCRTGNWKLGPWHGTGDLQEQLICQLWREAGEWNRGPEGMEWRLQWAQNRNGNPMVKMNVSTQPSVAKGNRALALRPRGTDSRCCAAQHMTLDLLKDTPLNFLMTGLFNVLQHP